MRTGDELVAREAELHAEARAFLDEHDVEARLARAGPVLFVGSFVTGLMVWRDLDVCVAADGLDRAGAWALVEPFVLAADRVRYEHLTEPDDRRHYFVLRLCGWKLDVWLLEHSRSIALIFLMVIGVFLIVRGAYDLAA